MEVKNAFSILVYLRKDQLAKDGKAPIMIKVTVNGKYSKFSTKLKDWDNKTARVKNSCKASQSINNKIEEILVSLRRHYQKFELNNEIVTAEKIKNAFFGKDVYKETLLGLFDKYLSDFKLQVNEGKNKSPKTLIKYEATYKRLSEFMKYKYNITDILLIELNYTFILDFEIYLRTVSKNSTNTIAKYMQQFKTIVLIAKNNNWIPVDPFINYKK